MRKTLLILLFCAAPGCRLSDTPPPPIMTPTTNPAMLATTQPFYWTTQPSVVQVRAASFQRLWSACERTSREFGFPLDRQDFRNGLMTTEPVISQQFFEPWRHDTGTASGVANNSLASYRRTIRFQIEKQDESYVMTPCVIVERFAQAEQPIASDIYLRSSMNVEKHPMLGTKETDRAIYLPRRYWYATGRDNALERDLAKAVEKKLR